MLERESEREKESCLLARKFAFFPLPWKWMVHRPKEKERNPTRLQGRPKKRRNCFQPWIYACARAHACVHLEKGESERERERERVNRKRKKSANGPSLFVMCVVLQPPSLSLSFFSRYVRHFFFSSFFVLCLLYLLVFLALYPFLWRRRWRRGWFIDFKIT